MTLDSAHQTSINKVERGVTHALADVGAAYISFERAERAFTAAKRHLSSCLLAASAAEQERTRVLSSIAEEMELEPGEWIYCDGELVKKGHHANKT